MILLQFNVCHTKFEMLHAMFFFIFMTTYIGHVPILMHCIPSYGVIAEILACTTNIIISCYVNFNTSCMIIDALYVKICATPKLPYVLLSPLFFAVSTPIYVMSTEQISVTSRFVSMLHIFHQPI